MQTYKMNKCQTFISNNLLRIVHHRDVVSHVHLLPLKYITSVQVVNDIPPRIIIQYNTLDQYSRTYLEYSTYNEAETTFNEIQKGLEDIYRLK